MLTMTQRKPLNEIPAQILCAQDYESLAEHFIEQSTMAYIAGGSDAEVTLRRNRDAFEQCLLQQRVLANVVGGTTKTQLLGSTMMHPIILAPVAHQKLVHEQGEIATVLGADAMDTIFTASTMAHTALEDIAQATPSQKWFQLYVQPEPSATLDLILRAEAAGYQALVLTVDVPINGLRLRAQRAGFVMPQQLQEANLVHYSNHTSPALEAGQSQIFDALMSQAPTWETLEWVMENTRLPVIVKGITHPEDARRAKNMGAEAIVVSNHGGRSMDGLPASLEALVSIREAVGADMPLLLDSGIRSGSDVFKALACGANAVMIGRLQIYALAVAGALGVAHMLRTLVTELELVMAQAGCASIAQIARCR